MAHAYKAFATLYMSDYKSQSNFFIKVPLGKHLRGNILKNNNSLLSSIYFENNKYNS